jgi:dolichyl-phosphate beta-glucosyltransferase
MASGKEQKSQLDLTIVMPAYSEERRVGATLDELANFLKHDRFFKRKNVEVLVVTADSIDKTKQIVLARKKLFKNFKLLKPGPPVGKGRDVQFGMLRAKGNFIVYMDADLATPLHHLERFYKACEHGSDIVVGTRNLLRHHPTIVRRFISNIGNILFRIVGGVWIEDSQCGFKMFQQQACQLCFSKLTILGWGFDMEILTIAKVNKLSIKTYRISDWKDAPFSTFPKNVLLIAGRSLKELGIIAINRMRGVYLQKSTS